MVGFRLMGPLSEYTGYAVGLKGIIRKLEQRKQVDFDLYTFRDIQTRDPDILEIFEREKRNFSHLGVLVGFPDVLNYLPTRYKCVYTMYEMTDIPEKWKENTRRANEIWVPCTFCAQVFSKYNKNIRIVKWGYNEEIFKPKRGKKKENEQFLFGSVGVMSKRKGVDVLVSAFEKAFNRDNNYRLIIKTRDTRYLPSIDSPMITVIDENWREDQLVDFYRKVDCIVQPSRGEGVSMVPLQAAGCGTPSIVTNFGGPADYCDDKGIFGIGYTHLSKPTGMLAKKGRWAEPNEDELVEKLRWIADKQPKVKHRYEDWQLSNTVADFEDAVKKAAYVYKKRGTM